MGDIESVYKEIECASNLQGLGPVCPEIMKFLLKSYERTLSSEIGDSEIYSKLGNEFPKEIIDDGVRTLLRINWIKPQRFGQDPKYTYYRPNRRFLNKIQVQ